MYEPNEYDSDAQTAIMESPYHPHIPLSEVVTNVQQIPQPSPYIINGKDAEAREFPWQVSLQVKSKSTHRCGGSILNSRLVDVVKKINYAFSLSYKKLKLIYVLGTF